MMQETPLILVVYEAANLQRLLAGPLDQAGYTVRWSEAGHDPAQAALDTRPDLILMELPLSGSNDLEALVRLKNAPQTSDIPVAVLSAYKDPVDKARVLENGAADLVDQPFEKTELLARIKVQIDLRRQNRALREYTQGLEEVLEERTRQLLHAERLASLGTLAAGIAHEINNPATFINGNLQTLAHFWNKISEHLGANMTEHASPQIAFMMKEFPDMIDSIRLGADRITDLVSGLKDFSRKDTAFKEWTDFKKCLREALNLTHNVVKHYIKVETYMSVDLPLIWANSQQLAQVLVNLIINAADAIGQQDGKITISAQPIEDNRIEIRLTDTGNGMSPEVMARIFEPFYTTKPPTKGTGLGLSITQSIIKDHLGTIDVASIPAQGTTFVITLPTQKQLQP